MTSYGRKQSDYFGNVDLTSRTKTVRPANRPRLAVTMTEKAIPAMERITDPAKMKRVILENLGKRSQFIPRKYDGIAEKPREISGILGRSFKLSDLHQWLGLGSSDDTEIFGILDSIAESGKAVFRRCENY